MADDDETPDETLERFFNPYGMTDVEEAAYWRAYLIVFVLIEVALVILFCLSGP